MKKLLAIILSVSMLMGLCVFNVSAEGEQKIYFEYPDSWSREGLIIDEDTHLANVYCFAYPIYGNKTDFQMRYQTKQTSMFCEDYDGEKKLFSIDLSKFGTIEDGADYGITFLTATDNNYMTVDLTMISDCVGDTVCVTPYNGMISPQSAPEPMEFYAAWKNTKNCGPKAEITSVGSVSPGVFPVYQPRAKHLSDALAKYLATQRCSEYFRYETNMYLCGVTGATPLEVFNQYLEDYSQYFVGEPTTDPSIPCPFYSYVFDKDSEEYKDMPNMATLPAPAYVREVLGIKTGDVNGDNTVDILDSAEVQKAAVDKVELNAAQKMIGDVTFDGNVNVLDAAVIQKVAAGKTEIVVI